MTIPPAQRSTPPADAADAPARPVLRVVRGTPTDAELAAVVAVLAAAGDGGGSAPEPAPPSRWASRAALVRRVPTPGPGAWRASAGPR